MSHWSRNMDRSLLASMHICSGLQREPSGVCTAYAEQYSICGLHGQHSGDALGIPLQLLTARGLSERGVGVSGVTGCVVGR